MEITDSTGEKVEVFTQEEVDAKSTEAREAAVEEYKRDNPDQTEDVEKLTNDLEAAQGDLKTANEALEAAGDKDTNFAALREKAEKAEANLKTVQTEMDEKFLLVKKEATDEAVSVTLKATYERGLAARVGDDEEVKKTVEVWYNKIDMPATNDAEIDAKLAAAYTLATTEPDEINSAQVSSGNVSRVTPKGEEEFSEEEKALGRKFGITDKDIQKYGGK